jgi:hypothetical protein
MTSARQVLALEEVAVEPAEVAIDAFGFLNVFNAIDGSRLALIE